MNFSTGGLRALSWPFIIGFVVVWNALNILAIWLNEGPRRYEDPAALMVLAGTCLTTALLSLGIVYFPGLRDLVTAEERRKHYEPKPFLFLAVIAGFLGGFMLFEALSRLW
jgi:hypothetical protein